MKFLGIWFTTALATFVALWLTPGITLEGGVYAAPILTALILSLLDASVKPLLKLLSLPITFITLGLFSLVINAAILELASWLTRSIFDQGLVIDSFGSAFLGAIIISIVSALINTIIN